MAKVIRINTLAVQDMAAITDSYDAISRDVGDRFRAALRSALQHIENYPEASPRIVDGSGLRFRRLKKFPYYFLYSANPDCVEIAGVFNQSRD